MEQKFNNNILYLETQRESYEREGECEKQGDYIINL